MKRTITIGIILCLIFMGAAFFLLSIREKTVYWTAQNSLLLSAAPRLEDDQAAQSLKTAIAMSLRYLNGLDPAQQVHFATNVVTVQQLRNTLIDFGERLEELGLSEAFYSYINANYIFFKSAAQEVLFTGYFEARLNGARKRSERYRYPLYRVPEDLYKVELSKFITDAKLSKLPTILRARLLPEKTLIPYYSRAEIDYKGVLAGKGLEIAWVDDAIDLFFLHIQGSGVVQLEDGDSFRINYAETNGQAYRAIGRLLVERQILTPQTSSMQTIKKYLHEHPTEQEEIMSYNPSYIFFREVKEGPLGSVGVPLTPYRSIATDSSLFPRGALAFISTEKPVIEGASIVQWQKFSRFALNQDTGGAIRGPGRVDLFTGLGDESEIVAGNLKHQGALYFLLKKEK